MEITELNFRAHQTSRRLLPDRDRFIIYRHASSVLPSSRSLEHMELTLDLEEKARRKALAKARRLLHQDLTPDTASDCTQPPGSRRPPTYV